MALDSITYVIGEVAEKLGIDIGSQVPVSAERINLFFIECLEPSIDEFPTVAQEALQVAKGYYSGRSSLGALNNSKEHCWRYLVKRGIETNLGKEKTCQVRAVMCTLTPEYRPCDFFDKMEFFSGLMKRLGQESTVRMLMAEHFLGR